MFEGQTENHEIYFAVGMAARGFSYTSKFLPTILYPLLEVEGNEI